MVGDKGCGDPRIRPWKKSIMSTINVIFGSPMAAAAAHRERVCWNHDSM